MTPLIAQVATAIVNAKGEREIVPPGKPLPELADADAQALQAMGAARAAEGAAEPAKADAKPKAKKD